MTRINLVPPAELHTKHLLAEYRELPRVFKLARAWDLRGRAEPIPNKYTMGKGHVRFFYDKLIFCLNRQFTIYGECLSRGFNVQFDPEDSRSNFMSASVNLFNDYTPTPEALELNRARILERSPWLTR